MICPLMTHMLIKQYLNYSHTSYFSPSSPLRISSHTHTTSPPLIQHNFQIGADYSKEYNAGQYETDYNSGYGAVPKAAYMEAHSHKGIQFYH